MDSGNSNSVQSSSGGDEEYDSRAESISSFLNNNKSNNNPSIYLPRPAPATAHHHLYNTSLFDPLSSNYTFDPLSSSSSRLLASSNPNSLLNNNLDMVWSRNLRSEPNCTDLGGGLFIPSTSSPPPFSSSPAMLLQHIPRGGGGVTESVSKAASSSFLATSSSGHGRLNTDHSSLIRNPKKRSRASRRAPTTVLTTDTTNFRAMVQEFTGIPAPPFTSSSSPFSRTRLDLFGTSSRSPSYYNLLRPFAQKPISNPIPFNNNSSNNNSMIDAIASASTITAATPLQPSQNLFNINMQNNSILNLHSHSLLQLQLPTKYPLTNSPNNNLETKPPQQGSSLKDLGGAAHLNTNTLMSGLQSWPGAGVVGSNENREEELEPFANGKLMSNFSQVASSEFHRDKGQENVNAAAAATTTTRTEGMVESWICSSD